MSTLAWRAFLDRSLWRALRFDPMARKTSLRKSSRQPELPGLDGADPVATPAPAATSVLGHTSAPDVMLGQEAALQTAPTAPPVTVRTGDASDLRGQTVFVIDCNSLIFQVFHGIPEMTSPRGEPVNAIFGFMRDLLALLDRKPNYLFCAFDRPGPTFRHALYEPYKAQRSSMPDDLVPQFPHIERVITAFHMPVLGLDGYEADDILATLAYETERRGGNCVLVTADKDCRQLITDHVRVLNLRTNRYFDAAALREDWGIRPDQVVDFQALVGDAVDNVPGVARIGPKTARELLEKYDTLDRLYEHVAEITGAKKQYLIDGREKAFLSRTLVRLANDVPLTIDWQQGHVGEVDVETLLELCGEFGFHRFADQFRKLEIAAAPRVWQASYQTVATPADLERLVAQLAQQTMISFDTETTSVAPTQADLVGYSFAWRDGEAYYVPVRAPAGEPCLDPAATLAALRPVFENPAIRKLGQNLKYDLLVLRGVGVQVVGAAFDTMVASYLLEAGERNHNLDELAARYLNHQTIKISELIGTGKQQKRMDEVPVATITAYAAEDADVPLRLWPILERKLREAELAPLFNDLEMPLVEVLVELEHNGIRVDVPRLRELSAEYGRRLKVLEGEIHALAGHAFNIASPKQLQQVLFTELNLPILARTKTGPSTDADVLEELARQHPLPAKIIEYRQYAKLQGTYLDALPELVNPRTGRVHASFHQAVTATGRLSSSDPNLQNIPIRTETGREIRSAFLARDEGWLLLAADYSQIELRVLAHYCEDETLCAAFARDEDIHTLVASQVYNVELSDVTREMRRAAKAVNFGIIYGQSPFGLAKALDIDQTQAAQFIDAYFARYPGVEQLMTQILADGRRLGYVSTILGRRRSINGIRPDAGRQRNLSERTAINTVIQGSAADLIKLAMIAVHRRLRREERSARMLLQIHDELVFEAPEAEIPDLAALVSEEMSNVMHLRVPLKVDVKTGRNWAETEPWG